MGQARRPVFKPNKTLSAIQHFDQFRAVVAYVTRRHAKASFERTIEIGQITKARAKLARARGLWELYAFQFPSVQTPRPEHPNRKLFAISPLFIERFLPVSC
jgi:hypothetical protein